MAGPTSGHGVFLTTNCQTNPLIQVNVIFLADVGWPLVEMSVCTFTVCFCCCGGGLKLLHFEKYASIIVRKYKRNTTQIIVKNTSLKGNMINGINRLGNGIGNQSLKLRRGRVHEGCWAKWIFETEELPRARCKINEDYLEWIIQSYSSIFF